jgi:hypothetical protein
MKDQYFGDINDYRKYGLLRCILDHRPIKPCVAWMLTPDDDSEDGNFISYLSKQDKSQHYDPELYQGLKRAIGSNPKRRVSLIEETELLNGTKYFSKLVPDNKTARQSWLASLLDNTKECNFVFLDPDNGVEVKSKPFGCKNSSKYVYWNEIGELWNNGKSLLIYQHFPREKREKFIQRMLTSLREKTHNSVIEAFSTSNVVFLMALQPEHHELLPPIVNLVNDRWMGQISSYELQSSKPSNL